MAISDHLPELARMKTEADSHHARMRTVHSRMRELSHQMIDATADHADLDPTASERAKRIAWEIQDLLDESERIGAAQRVIEKRLREIQAES